VSGNLRKLYGLASALILTGTMAGCATYGSGINTSAGDAKTTANVQALLDRHPELGANSISVQTVDRVVYLNGMASTGLESREAASVAGEVPGVTRVVNLIAVSR
jgi:osmotically-inducible protein OsmY